MAERGDLERLAALHGIALEYVDIWGRAHRASPATLAGLLAAMDVRVTGDAEARAESSAEEARRFRRLVPAAVVVPAACNPTVVRVGVPETLDNVPLRWQVREESGTEHGGLVHAVALHADESVAAAGTAFTSRDLVLPLALPAGYHRLTILRDGTPLGTTLLIAAPPRCYQPPALAAGGRIWGVAVQLYGVRTARNWGIGDFSDLRTLVEQWGSRGAGIVGVNPLHALFPHNPSHASPYSPSSRQFLNWLYIDVEACADFGESDELRTRVNAPEFQARLQELREAELIDYPRVAEVKRLALDLLYANFRARHLGGATERARAFRAFQQAGGEALRRHALFEAIQESLHRDVPSTWGWPVWPDAYRDADSPAVREFAAEHLDRVEFYEYLQWQADLQLGAAAAESSERGLAVGIYQDLAVSIDRGGAEAWSGQDLYALAASIGAPPDAFNLLGQDWGLPPLIPERLRDAAFAPFILTLRANMKHAGALRIDHAMGLFRLFWVPKGGRPVDGTYVRYPLAEMLGIVTLESHRNRCMVIGEDLGTVPDEVRTALAAAGVLSYRLLFFERNDNGSFKPPGGFAEQALVAGTTHDLPTLAGWWEGRDLALRLALGLFPSVAARDAAIVERAQDRAQMLLALEREQLLPPGATPNPVSMPAMTPEFALALQVYLARTPSQVMVVQVEDVLGVRDQANLPATIDEHPNWRRRLPLPLERLPDDSRFHELTRALVRERGGPSPAGPPATGAVVARIPRATYRLQLHGDFDFAAATALVPYLARLGVSHVYCSPYLRARPGSRHGYDIIDHGSLNPEIGDANDFGRFVAALKAHGMGQIVDVVPNHMGIMGSENRWWMDVLENGPASVYAEYFDIDWEPIDPTLAGHLLLPVLGDQYGLVLERGELALAYEPSGGSFAVMYYAHRFPVDPREYPRILERSLKGIDPAEVPPGALAELESVVTGFRHLPARTSVDAGAIAERNRDKEVQKGRLARLVGEHSVVAAAIDRTLRQLNGSVADRASFEALHELLEAQAYRLAYWRVADDEINYRRFFDINDLAALRMENVAAFEATHGFVLSLAADGVADGLRIDHPDGLYDPAAYFRRLQEGYARRVGAALPVDAGQRWPLYVVVEKITAPHERMPESWAIHGATGYRFANLVNGLFVPTGARARLDRAWRAFVRDEAVDFAEAAHRGKRAIMRSALAGELAVLARRMLKLARADRRTRDFMFNRLQQALAEVVAHFPVYRTYVAGRPSAQDRRYIEWAVTRARASARATEATVFDFVRQVLLVQPPAGATDALRADYLAAAMRFQQYTAPVTAKGVEDTAFYVFNRLVSLNDVGSDPDQFGVTVSAFHGASADRARKWPHTMLTTSTHDNKRSEDVRARIDVLAETPAAWRLLGRRWSRLNRSRIRPTDHGVAPSRNDEYLLYQTLLGTFPVDGLEGDALTAYCARIQDYMLKASREAKVRTSWVNPDEAYEQATRGFVQALLSRSETNLFLDDLGAQARIYGWFGALNSLSMALVKLTSPGVPDIYQGNEVIDLSLVDPDNRRPVDYGLRHRLLDDLEALVAEPPVRRGGQVRALLATPHDGRAKLWVTWRVLGLRRDFPALLDGSYRPVAASGVHANHLIAYARCSGTAGSIVVAGRLFASLSPEPGVAPVGREVWGDTAIELGFVPSGTMLHDELTGAEYPSAEWLPVAEVLAHFSCALLRFGQA